MNLRRLACVVLAHTALGWPLCSWTAEVPAYTPEQLGLTRYTAEQNGHIKWVMEVFERMQTIKPGMTRKQLLQVFRTEGGIHTGLQRTYVSRDCPFFKVDVEFQAVGRPARDPQGRVTLVEGEQDVISRISTPYLQPEHAD